MPIRGLIIGIEDYPLATDLPKRLKGTNEAADEFHRWLHEVKGISPSAIRYCTADGRRGRTGGTTRDDIISEVQALVNEGRDNTEELYVFFSGHGFSYPERSGRRPVDILVASNFTNLAKAGYACLKLGELQEKIQAAMGLGDHFYFIDSCRTILERDQEVALMDLGVNLGVSSLGTDCLYTLFSTSQGEVARTDSGFARRVLEGLKGTGRAKRWHKRKLYVTFETLKAYVRDAVNQEADANVFGTCDGLILALEPPPTSLCTVEVVNADVTDSFQLMIQDGKQWSRQYPFSGSTKTVEVPPEEYSVAVANPNVTIRRIEPPLPDAVDLWSDRTLKFEKQLSGPILAEAPSNAILKIDGMGDYEIAAVRTQSTDDSVTTPRSGMIEVAPGSYRFDLKQRGFLLKSQEVTLAPGATFNLRDLIRSPSPDPLIEGILQATGNPADSVAAEFSESLGRKLSCNLGLWLSVLGASRILYPGGSHVRHLPLDNFEDVLPDDAVIYVLAGFHDPSEIVHTAVSTEASVTWEETRAVVDMPGLSQSRVYVSLGGIGKSMVFSYSRNRQVPVSIATHCLPNRATFITLSEDEQGETEVHQYLLPIHSLTRFLDPRVWQELAMLGFFRRPLAFVRFLWQVQYDFALKRKIADVRGSVPVSTYTDEDNNFWMDAIYGKWLDPMIALIAAYELIRRGGVKSSLPLLKQALNNLNLYFTGIPDIQAIAKMIGESSNFPASPPMVLDGLLAFSDGPVLGKDTLSYDKLWTAWRGMVNAVETAASALNA
jgi:Caspase domain